MTLHIGDFALDIGSTPAPELHCPRTIMMMFNSKLLASLKDDIQAASLEFIGTFFLLLGLGGIQAAAFSNQLTSQATSSEGSQSINKVASIEQLTYIAASMGLSLLVSAWLFYRVTGGLFNPAVSTSLLLVGAIGPVRFVLYCIAQLLGGIVASALLLALLPGPLLVNTSPGPSVNDAQAVFIEMFITSALCFAVLMLAAEKHNSTPFAPIGIGLTLFVCQLWAVPFTGAAMNTARAFGPAVVTEFATTHWIYWLGPFLGSLLATAFYSCLKMIKYWRLNPDQDNPQGDPPPNPAQTLSSALAAVTSPSTSETARRLDSESTPIGEKRTSPKERQGRRQRDGESPV